MLNLKSGDRIEMCYEDSPTTTIRATVGRLLTDREEGMGIEVVTFMSVDRSGGTLANNVL